MATAEIIKQKDEVLGQLNERVAALVKRGEAIQVTDQASDVLAKQFKVEVKSYEKAVELYADGDIQDAKERLSTLQTAKKMLLAPVLEVFETVEKRRKLWEEEERKKAEAEQRREQERARIEAARKAADERREQERIAEEERKRRQKEIEEQRKAGELKAAEARRLQKQADEDAVRQKALAAEQEKDAAANVPVIAVKPNITAVAGTASRRNWKFRIVDQNKIPRIYMMPNDVEIGRMVRGTQDKAKAEAQCPGVEVWSE